MATRMGFGALESPALKNSGDGTLLFAPGLVRAQSSTTSYVQSVQMVQLHSLSDSVGLPRSGWVCGLGPFLGRHGVCVCVCVCVFLLLLRARVCVCVCVCVCV